MILISVLFRPGSSCLFGPFYHVVIYGMYVPATILVSLALDAAQLDTTLSQLLFSIFN